jgi:uncharacterized membrane protein YhfC
MNFAVPLTFAAVAALEIAIPLLLALAIVRRFGLSWAIFLYGVVFFILSQAIHIPLLLVIQPPYVGWAKAAFPDPVLLLVAIGIFLGAFAGLLEEGIRYLVISKFFPSRGVPVTRETGLLFGVGWGGIESIAVGVVVTLSLYSYLIASSGGAGLLANMSDPAQAAAINALLAVSPTDILAGLVERCTTLILHVAFTFLVLFAVMRSRPIFLAAAIAFHALFDAVAVVSTELYGIWPTEAAIAGFAAIGVVVIVMGWRAAGKTKEWEPVEREAK